MKIQINIAKNSGSSSFAVARGSEWTEEQREMMIRYAERELFGEKLLQPGDPEEMIQEIFDELDYNREEERKIRKALKEGKTIYGGDIGLMEAEWNYENLREGLWKALEESDSGRFEIVSAGTRTRSVKDVDFSL